MCSGSRSKPCQTDPSMEGIEFENKDEVSSKFSVLLEFSASDDLTGFKIAVEEEGCDVDESSYWYGRRIGSKKMGFEERTPLLIAAMFGSKQVLTYILETGLVDVNRACGSDNATALHCAVAGGSASSLDAVKLLLGASANIYSVDANGNRPSDLVVQSLNSSFSSRRKMLEGMLNGSFNFEKECVLADLAIEHVDEQEQEEQQILTPAASKELGEKKEYPVNLSLTDINNGIYGTDEFRMYTFKVKPCSRAYSHDWTECPFVHPGENARRRDPRKYHYSCVPCPEFRKGTCRQGDACEYAHGIFESWLHPAQYRTRLCKDETGCNRRVCFFAHKPEELRPLYASTGSAVPSPRSFSNGASSLDVMSMSPFALGSSLTPPMTPLGGSSPGSMWQTHPNIVPPTLQLPGSRLKTSMSTRDMDFDPELLGLESHCLWQHQLMDEMSSLSSPSGWNNAFATTAAFGASSMDMNGLGGVKPSNLDDIFASQVQSPSGIQIRQNLNQQLRSSYPTSLSSSPGRASLSFGIDPAAAVLNSRAAAFAKRSQSFIDRSTVSHLSGLASPAAAAIALPCTLSDWGSPNGKLDWGIQKEELHKLRKSASFGFRSNSSSSATPAASMLATGDEPDVSWVQSLVKDVPTAKSGHIAFEEQQFHLNSGGSEMLPSWVEQEQIVA